MKNCIRVPKVYIPRKDFEKWLTLGRDRFSDDPSYWQRVERAVGDAPSALRFLLPREEGEDEAALIHEIREAMFALLEDGSLEKLNRGGVLVSRETAAGTRHGILLCIDLEAYTMSEGEVSHLRPSQAFDREAAARVARLRKGTVLEFPHAAVFYRDKHKKIVRWLGEELEEIYTACPETGPVSGCFIPEPDAADVAEDLRTRGDPCFAVADGEEELAGAKMAWEDIKSTLSPAEILNHPARFALVEFLNLYEDAAAIEPLHRLVTGIETEAFCGWFCKQLKCKREGNLLYPAVRDGADAVKKTDALIAEFLRRSGGRVKYIRSEELALAREEECAAVVLKGIKKEDLFSYLKGGKRLPAHTFVLGGEQEGRYHLEGREISYD